MTGTTDLQPFDNCPALDGYHCQTNSLAKIYHFFNHPLTEDMLLGLGAGMGFIYWKMKFGESTYVFMGGRGNTKDFFDDIGRRTGVKISVKSTSSVKKAEVSLLERLERKEPVLLFGDMGYLPWFEFPEDYHFGGHTFVVCGFDGKDTVLASDMDPKASGLKGGFYFPTSMEQLKKARNSPHKPFPPKNTYLEFDFADYHQPTAEDIISSIQQAVESQLFPPIKNLGVKGLRHSAKEIKKWPSIFGDHDLRMNLFSIYIFFEIGGTGGGCFRYMYSRFLKEAAEITGNDKLLGAANKLHRAGEMYSEIGLLFKEAEKAGDIKERIAKASDIFLSIAGLEENALSELARIII
jgi:hypothetical protein